MTPHPQEQSLIAAYRSGDLRAADQLLRHYDPLFHRVAGRFTHDPADGDDVEQAARIGFIKSLATHQPPKLLSTHARWDMSHEIRDVLLSLRCVRAPKWIDEAVKTATRLGVATDSESMVETGIVHPTVRPFDAPTTVALSSASDVSVSAPDPTDTLSIRELLRSLTAEEQNVIDMRFWTGHTLDEAGAQIGLSKERIRQIQDQALLKLHKRLTSTGARKAA